MTTQLRTCIRLLDGPEAGETIMGYDGEPPDMIAVFRTQMIAEGTLVCGPSDDPLEGDHLYRKVSRSELLDAPDFKPSPHIMLGCAFTYISTVGSDV